MEGAPVRLPLPMLPHGAVTRLFLRVVVLARLLLRTRLSPAVQRRAQQETGPVEVESIELDAFGPFDH